METDNLIRQFLLLAAWEQYGNELTVDGNFTQARLLLFLFRGHNSVFSYASLIYVWWILSFHFKLVTSTNRHQPPSQIYIPGVEYTGT